MTSTRTGAMKIWGMQFVGNIVLAAIAWWWLGWPDAHAWQVLMSFVVAVVVVVAWLSLQYMTFAHFSSAEEQTLRGRLLRALPAFTAGMFVLAIGLWFGERIYDDAPRLGTRFAQILHASPRMTIAVLEWKIRAIEFIWACFCVSLLSGTAALGFSAFRSLRDAFAPLRSLRYWLGMLIAVLGGIYLPCKLANWAPKADTLKSQAISMGIRFLLAYVLVVSAVVLMAWLAGGPRKAVVGSAAARD